ncbi:MAG: nucleotide exchange factor GrpE [Lachnospiraceae bacterium]|nr:nucleotide exchange factor GrpE [Lachnospiraceae bacterium]MCI7596416.1 nucleotide exchange factor GrpE [Lachnospiraceae bacterium]MDD7050931.1 nucleotide exchange factor GrpE [Lachnospiraceae bacterium]MDY3222667.1 nucleotide exchange factor GrpE [Lachnospiraceae bacterium]MDY4095328.1 nucleotide exchange factor GrpE [Lachnospiraceae bacterium]
MQDIFDEELADMVAEEIVEERAKAFENLGDAVDEMLGEDKAAQEADEEGDESSAGGADEKQAAAEDEASDSKKGEKKFFQKKGDKKTAVLEEKIAQLEDQTKRQMAEFDNFRKRTEKEKNQMFETGARSVIEKILPIIDNFERGLITVEEDNKDSFYDGMCMIHKQMLAELEKIGVTPIEALGQEFDPNLHNAVMQVESEEFESGIVAQELLKGYKYRDTVVRHSMVAVVQ